jgi:glutamyl-tRNA synthetase
VENFRLRIEDTDLARNNEDAMKAIINAFDWVGLNYDGEVFINQKEQIFIKFILINLLENGNAYKCYMSKDELDALRARQEAAKQTPRYDGTWRPEDGKVLPQIPEGIEPVIRIKAPKTGTIRFEDGVKGDMKFDASFVDDFVIARSNGMPTYNFVVAIDDA